VPEFHKQLFPPADDGSEEAGPILSDLADREVLQGVTVSTGQRSGGKKSSSKSSGHSTSGRRRVVVLISLVAVLTFTSALLRGLAPAPINQQASSSLFAVGAPQSIDEIFDTSAAIESGRWQYIYIHHSATAGGNASTLAQPVGGLPDHFVIGNGDGCADGEIQVGQRWTQQLVPGRTPGADWILPNCISICLIGDFSQGRPTAAQQRHLAGLVSSLQAKLHIPRSRVWFDTKADTAAGIGAYFPASDFKGQILP
jgi:hypothetical protein